MKKILFALSVFLFFHGAVLLAAEEVSEKTAIIYWDDPNTGELKDAELSVNSYGECTPAIPSGYPEGEPEYMNSLCAIQQALMANARVEDIENEYVKFIEVTDNGKTLKWEATGGSSGGGSPSGSFNVPEYTVESKNGFCRLKKGDNYVGDYWVDVDCDGESIKAKDYEGAKSFYVNTYVNGGIDYGDSGMFIKCKTGGAISTDANGAFVKVANGGGLKCDHNGLSFGVLPSGSDVYGLVAGGMYGYSLVPVAAGGSAMVDDSSINTNNVGKLQLYEWKNGSDCNADIAEMLVDSENLNRDNHGFVTRVDDSGKSLHYTKIKHTINDDKYIVPNNEKKLTISGASSNSGKIMASNGANGPSWITVGSGLEVDDDTLKLSNGSGLQARNGTSWQSLSGDSASVSISGGTFSMRGFSDFGDNTAIIKNSSGLLSSSGYTEITYVSDVTWDSANHKLKMTKKTIKVLLQPGSSQTQQTEEILTATPLSDEIGN